MAQQGWILGQPVETQTVYEWVLGKARVLLLAGVAALSVNVSDGVGVVDAVASQIQVYEVSVDDGVGVVDDIAAAIPVLEINVADAVGVADDITTDGWLGVNSSDLLAGGVGTGYCGHSDSFTVNVALNGTDYWKHNLDHVHWFIIDLGTSKNITKVRGRSNLSKDPTSVNIYVSDDTGDWGTAVATGITTWQDRTDWDTDAIIDTTPKTGQYLKVEIVSTEDVSDYIMWGLDTVPFAIFDIYVETVILPVLEVDASDGVGVAEDIAPQIKVYEVAVDDTIGVAESITVVTSVFEIDVSDSVGIVDYSLPQITPYEVSVDDDIGVSTATTPLFNLYIVNVDDDIGVATDATIQVSGWAYSLTVYDGVGVDTYVLPQICALRISTYDDVGLKDWRLHNIPGAIPIGTVDLFRFPRVPTNADEEMKRFLIDLESALRTVLTGNVYVGGTINADGCKLGDVVNYVGVNGDGVLTFHGRAGLIHGHCYGNHITWPQTNMAENTWYAISDEDMITSHLRGITHDGKGKLTVGSDGEYLVDYHGTYALDAANKHIEWAIKVNTNTPEAEGRDHAETKFSGQEEHMAGHGSVILSAGDYVQIVVRVTDTGIPDITVEFLNLSLTQIGGVS